MYTDEYNATLQLSGKMETPCGESFYYVLQTVFTKSSFKDTCDTCKEEN